MPTRFTSDRLVEDWEDFFKRPRFKRELNQIAIAFPDKRSIIIPYNDIARYDAELADYLLENPKVTIEAAEEAIQKILPQDARVPIHFRVRDLPPDKEISRVEIRDLRSNHVGTLIAIEGLIRRATEVRPRLVVAAFMCEICSSITEVKQDDIYMKEPIECNKDSGGCGRVRGKTRFTLILEKSMFAMIGGGADRLDGDVSKFVDTQKIEVQESPEGLRGGEQPQRLEIYSQDDLVSQITPGDRVVLNGILKSRQRGRPGPSRSTFFDLYLDLVSVDHVGQEFEEIEILKKDEKLIKKAAKDKNLVRNIVGSIAPSIYGMEIEKEAIALALFSGVPKIMSDKNRTRGDIHILLVGDPGVAKSQILAYVSKLAPRGIYTSGKAATAAGLTAAAVRSEEFGEGRWTLEAGALVLADKGVACIDELDKMSDRDRDSMHTAMEQQQFSIAKAGITATLQTRCSILAAANPQYGRFDPHKLLPEQINLDPAMLSRFDVIFTIKDEANENVDRALADHILKLHFAGEASEYRRVTEDEQYREDEEKIIEEKGPPFQPEFLRKYIAFAKKNIFPVMTTEAMGIMSEYYVTRRRRAEGGPVQLTPRNIEAMIRLAEACARMKLKDKVTADDANTAIKIVRYYLETSAGTGVEGEYDIDIITTGFATSQRDRIWAILDIIKDIQGATGATRDDIIQIAVERGIPAAQVEKDLDRLRRDGRIYQRYGDKYTLV